MDIVLIGIRNFIEGWVMGAGLIYLLLIIRWITRSAPKFSIRYRLGKVIFIGGLTYLLLSIFSPASDLFQWLLYKPVSLKNLKPAQVIVCLGGGVLDEGQPQPNSLLRAWRASKLFLDNKANKIVFTNGFTNKDSPLSEAASMRLIAKALDVPEDSIMLEEKSLNTAESAKEVARILKPMGISKIILVSNTYHLLRASLMYRKEGFTTQACPVSDSGWSFSDWSPSWGSARRMHICLSELMGIIILLLG